MDGGVTVLNVSSWRWPQWLLFGLALVAVASYLGLISFGGVEAGLERLAGPPEATASVFEDSTGSAEALFIVFGFLLLAPVALIVVASVPMAMSAVVAAYLNRMVGLPVAVTTLVIWLIAALAAIMVADAWLPWVKWSGQLVARAFLIALQ